MFRILFTGGGTGGHIYPILAVAEELKTLSRQKNVYLELKYLGPAGRYQSLLAENDISVSNLISAKIRRYFDLKNFLDIPFFFLSVIQAFWKVFWLMPDVLFSKGGPGSFPVVLASWFYRIPAFIHESDSIPGISNRLAARFAQKIAVSFNSTADFFPRRKAVLVGNPIRQSLLNDILDQSEAKTIFNLNPQKPLIFVVGGSQGSERINDFMTSVAEEFIKAEIQILHQTGFNNFDNIRNELKIILKGYSEEEKKRYKIALYFEKDLKDVYAAADIVVSRAGSGSIFEIAAFGKPSILIPLPEAAQNHQISNAYEYAKNGAAIVVEETNLKPHIFIDQIKKLLSDSEKLKNMSEAAKKFSKPEAGKIIAEEIIRLSA